MTGKRAQAKEQNRRLILDAARKVSSELGYTATTVRDIIRATPLASGTFYNYYTSKEEVFQAMRDEAALALRPQLRAARLKAENAEGFLDATFRTFFAYVAAHRSHSAAEKKRETVHVRVDSPEVLAGFEELHQDIQAAIARGLFPAVDDGFLTEAIIGTAFEIAEEMQKREAMDIEAATRFATALFMGGIGALPRTVNGQTDGAI